MKNLVIFYQNIDLKIIINIKKSTFQGALDKKS